MTETSASSPTNAAPPKPRPRDAATLILVDRNGGETKVLLGRRHSGHVFMPGKLVFPGGRVDPTDHRVAPATLLDPITERRLTTNTKFSAARARALAVAAVRELYEETGLCLGAFAAEPPKVHDLKQHFHSIGLQPDLGALRLVARALTPPGRVRRFNTFFFAADAGAVRHSIRDVVGTETELVELAWLTLDEARAADIPPITGMVLGDLKSQLADGFEPRSPIPFYHMKRGTRQRDLF